ncbi:MAG: hypothetical protein K8R88_05585 [Armatimonadetes bacterium]|nr:hypothetical protein [Armatimonadota bacterium]
MQNSPLKLQIFGPFKLSRADGSEVEFAARSAAAAVAYCGIHRGQLVRRSDLALELWPNADSEAARTNLRTALHRVRKACPDYDLVLSDGEYLELNLANLDFDAVVADQRHRQYLLAPNDEAAVESLQAEWNIRKKPLLEGWEDEWVSSLRIASDYAANETGREHARTAEAVGNSTLALTTWHEIHSRVPHQVEALKNGLRLETELHGSSSALLVAEGAQKHSHSLGDGHLPDELKSVIASVRSGALESVPKPEILRTRSEILMLARIFESNLKSNRDEALSMILAEAQAEIAKHPRTILSLILLGLSATSGDTKTRSKLAMLAGILGSRVGDYEAGHYWSDFAINSLSLGKSDRLEALANKGFMYLEQRQHALAERTLEQAVSQAKAEGMDREHAIAKLALAGVYMHTKEFAKSANMYREAIESVAGLDEAIVSRISAPCYGNLCILACHAADWENAKEYGERAMEFTQNLPFYRWFIASPLGLAQYMCGNRDEGIRNVAFGVSQTARERLLRYNQISLDFAIIVLAREGKKELAKQVAEVSSLHRASIRHKRSRAEADMLLSLAGIEEAAGLALPQANLLASQSFMTVNAWVCESLDALIAN